jgi:hypothetical protein
MFTLLPKFPDQVQYQYETNETSLKVKSLIWDVVRIRDPEKKSSRIRIPDPWGKKAPDPGSGSATLVVITNSSSLLRLKTHTVAQRGDSQDIPFLFSESKTN